MEYLREVLEDEAAQKTEKPKIEVRVDVQVNSSAQQAHEESQEECSTARRLLTEDA